MKSMDRPWIVSFLLEEKIDSGKTACKEVKIREKNIVRAISSVEIMLIRKGHIHFFVHNATLGDEEIECPGIIEDDPIGWPEDDLDEWEW